MDALDVRERRRWRLPGWIAFAAITCGIAACATPDLGPPTGNWRREPSLVHARAAHAVASTDEAIYAFAGTGKGGAPVRAVERFDGKAWRDVGPMPGPGLNAPAAVALDGKVYLIGGFATDTNVPTDGVLVYDVATKIWSRAAPLPAPRGGHAAVVLAGRIHVFGGGNSRATIADHDVYDPARNAWSSLAPLPRAEGSPAGVAFDGKLYAIGGRSGPDDFGDVYVFDPLTGAWTSAAPIPPRGTAGAAAYCGAIYVFGGESQARNESLGDVLWLPRGGTWSVVSTLPTPRNFARAVVFNDAVFVVGGSPTPEPSHASEGSAVVERYFANCTAVR